MGSFIKNLIALGGVVLIGVGGYYLVVIRQDATLEGNNSLVVSQAERETQEFLSRLDDLRTIELSSAIFSDPRFSTLQDFTGPIGSRSYGRNNPFVAQ